MLPYHIWKSWKLRKLEWKNVELKDLNKQQELITIKEDESDEYDDSENNNLNYESESDKLINQGPSPLLQAKLTMKNIRHIEKVSIPQQDPYPVKVGRNLLIETSFEEKESETNDEEPVEYHEHKDHANIVLDTLDMALERFKDMQTLRQKVSMSWTGSKESETINEMRRRCKEDNKLRIRQLALTAIKENSKRHLKTAMNKIRMVKALKAEPEIPAAPKK